MENFSYTYSLFKGSYSMESKIIEFSIILLNKCSRADKGNLQIIIHFYSQHLHYPNTLSYFFISYDITSLGNIHPITF